MAEGHVVRMELSGKDELQRQTIISGKIVMGPSEIGESDTPQLETTRSGTVDPQPERARKLVSLANTALVLNCRVTRMN